MTMSASVRKLALTTHVTLSVGWLGAVAAFLALAVAGLTSTDDQTVRAAYLAMEITGRYVLVPLSLISLVTGLVQSLGTSWGLFRHYWVLTKLALSAFATGVLLAYMQTLDYLAGVAAQPATPSDGVLPSASPVLHAAGALLVLLAAVTLSVYKPRGLTRYGWRRQQRKLAQP